MHNLVWLLINVHREAEAEPLARQVLERTLEAHGPDYPLTLLARRHLVYLLGLQDDPTADAEFQALIADHRRLFGPLHPDTINLIGQRGSFQERQERYADAENTYREVLELKRQIFDSTHISYLLTALELIDALRSRGKSGEAAALLSSLLPVLDNTLGVNHPFSVESRVMQAQLVCDLGRPAEAETMLGQMLADEQQANVHDGGSQGRMCRAYGEVLLHLGRIDEAEQACCRLWLSQAPRGTASRGW